MLIHPIPRSDIPPMFPISRSLQVFPMAPIFLERMGSAAGANPGRLGSHCPGAVDHRARLGGEVGVQGVGGGVTMGGYWLLSVRGGI